MLCINKDITPFAFYANFIHYHFFQFLAKGITIHMPFSMEYPPKNNVTQQSKQETDPKMNKQKQLYVLKIICTEKTKGTFRIGRFKACVSQSEHRY